MTTLDDDNITLDRLALWAVMLPIYAAVIGAILVWGYQVLTFLKIGAWLPYSANDGLHYLTGESWFVSPDSWLGVHSVLEFFNAGWALLISVGAAVTLATALIAGHSSPRV